MKEQFYNQLLTKLSPILDKDSLENVSRELTIVLNDYEISKRNTSIVVYNDYIPECVKTYLVVKKINGLKDSSLKIYWLRLNQFFQMVQLPIEKITTNDIRLWLYNFQKQSIGKYEEHVTNRTLDHTRTIICNFFKWAHSEKYILSNPCENINAIKYQRREREYLSEVELELLRNSCNNLRDKALVETFYSTGCRVSEVVNIKINDINLNNNEITVLGKGDKYRQVYINTKAKLAIINYLNSRKDDNPYLFISLRNKKDENVGLTVSGVEKTIRLLGRKSGINRRIHPHLLRHTTATYALQRGMDIVEIQKMLGHANIDTTLIYAKVSKDAVKNSHKKFII